MGQVRIVIQDHIGGKKTTVEVPDDVPMERLLPALARRMQLPLDVDGNEVSYRLDHPETGLRLTSEVTLASSGIQNEDILTILPEMTAASIDRVRHDRLFSDYKRMQALVEHSGLIDIEQTIGDPPEQYVVAFRCTGIAEMGPDGPILNDYHQVLIDLPYDYPVSGPRVRWVTPIFHPNIDENGTRVCINVWYPSRFLDNLCIMLGEMIQYCNYYPNEAYNGAAMLWALDHPEVFPIDKRPIITVKLRENKTPPAHIVGDNDITIKLV